MKAKIADFGLCTRIYLHYNEKKGPKENIVPIRWTALEVLLKGEPIKEFGDVWSFGVFIWEVFHLGVKIPYGEMTDYEKVIKYLKDGHRLSKPELCPQHIYDLMIECWSENYLQRPTFLQLKDQLMTDPKKQSSRRSSTLIQT